MKTRSIPEDRCPTGIPGFDELCQGGFVRNSINSVFGGPGAGKTTFLLQFLWNGVNKFNENGLHISFESHDEDIFLDAFTFGWDFIKLDKAGKCKFIRVSPKITIRGLKDQLAELVLKGDIRRVCIDPVSILSLYLKDESMIRRVVFDLTTMLKRFNITTLIADETVEGSVENFSMGSDEPRTQSMKFLSDGLINLYSSGLGGESDRAIRIAKMRRTNHVRGPVPFEIKKNGIAVLKKKITS
ncbi:hypothetical protein GF386_00985 [Candidatus Pacearchaeota archaeon]|nr:hypothetical protein [Candidatus Pacearchaeota archaeon]MBD3282810.1 hypothetical protein [Candidatus Pacearchaeota archaeon]